MAKAYMSGNGSDDFTVARVFNPVPQFANSFAYIKSVTLTCHQINYTMSSTICMMFRLVLLAIGLMDATTFGEPKGSDCICHNDMSP